MNIKHNLQETTTACHVLGLKQLMIYIDWDLHFPECAQVTVNSCGSSLPLAMGRDDITVGLPEGQKSSNKHGL